MCDAQVVTQTISQPPTLQLQPDPRLNTMSMSSPNNNNEDLARLPASEALRLLSSNLELLVHITGDVPPTPPPRTPTDPQMSGLEAEKQHLARSRQGSPTRSSFNRDRFPRDGGFGSCDGTVGGSGAGSGPIDGVKLKTDGSGSGNGTGENIVVGQDVQSLAQQHGAITRKFYSKVEPPISVTQYLSRLHQFMPMSPAVYLATSLYIHRLAVEQHALPVTRKNVHRLVLAALRVATKALEDLAYGHSKVARIGGVSEAELARLEISFCFLAGFELVVGEEILKAHWMELRGRGDAALPDLRIGGRRGQGVATPEEQ